MDNAEIIPSTGDRNLGPMLIGVNWAIFGPATILVCLRLITRIWITRNFGWDDAVIGLTQVSNPTYTPAPLPGKEKFCARTQWLMDRRLSEQIINAVGMGFVMIEVDYGLGRHVRYLPLDHYEGFLKYNFLDWIQVFVTLALSKISICLFLLRISKFERWRWFLFGLIAFLVVTHVPLTLLYMFQCIPIQKAWQSAQGPVPGHCMSKKAVEKIIIVQGGRSTRYSKTLSYTGFLPRKIELEQSLISYSLLNNHRLHRRRLSNPPPLERPPRIPHQSSPQPPHGPRRRHRHRLHRPYLLLVGDPLRRLYLGRRRKRPDPYP